MVMAPDERVDEATRSFLDTHPEAEGALREVVERDAEGESWTFEEVPLDSGRFGTLVSEGVVEKTDDGGYRLADRAAVERALTGEEPTATSSDTESAGRDVSVSVDRSKFLALLGAVAVIVIARALEYGSVFQYGRVISPANDPYYFRYWQRRLIELSANPTDLSAVMEIPAGAAARPMTHAANWWFTALLGGSASAADTVAAWLPILASVALGLVLYRVAVTLTADVRIGVATVLAFALIPVHAGYTALGFFDHQLHQYFWLGVVVYMLVVLAVDRQGEEASAAEMDSSWRHAVTPKNWLRAGGLAIALVASVYAWTGSALVMVPIGAYVGVRVLLDVREEFRPLPSNAPLLGGLVLGTVLTFIPHTLWGWQQLDSPLVIMPAVVTVLAIGVVLVGELWTRLEARARSLVFAEGALAGLAIVAFRYVSPDEFARLQQRLDEALLGREGILEVASLFRLDAGLIFGPFYYMGPLFYLGVIVMVWLSWVVYRRDEPGYLVPVVFGWYFLALASIQVRFAGQLSLFMSVFGGIAVVGALAWIDLARPISLFGESERSTEGELPDRFRGVGATDREPSSTRISTISMPAGSRRLGLIAFFALLLLGGNGLMVSFQVDATTYDTEVDALQAIDEHARVYNRSYPANYVLSNWGDSRMYNFFVNGEASGYGYARNNYESFITGENPSDVYQNYANRVGYVVLESATAEEWTLQHQLFDERGMGDDPVTHYQLIFDDSEFKAFALVEGAVLNVSTNANAGENVTVSTTVSVGDSTFAYERTVEANDHGVVTVRVPYAGTYEVGEQSVTVEIEDVKNGHEINVNA